MGVLDDIRSRCASVAARADLVQVDHDRLADLAVEVGPLVRAGRAAGDPGRDRFEGDVHRTVAYVVALDAVNFGSGWFPVLRKRPGASGYHTVAAAFRDHVDAEGPPTAEWLSSVTADDCCALFGQDAASEAAELMALFAEAWNQLGVLLLSTFDGSATALVESAAGSAERLVDVLRQMPAFEDRRRYRGIDVPFYKRAQITSADLDGAFGGTGPGRFHDLDRLTMFADNLVPHVLRVEGVLVLEPSLVDHIERGELVEEGSEAEVELRAVAVHAVEVLAEMAGVTPAALDHHLWTRGGDDRYKAVPRHRTRTTAY
jgi:hypothetical protein